MLNKRIIIVFIVTGLILLIPLVAMQFTGEVNWSLFDFVFAAILLLSTGLVFEHAMRKANNLAYKAAAAIAIGTAFLLIWSNLAVGITGSENNPVNLLYFGVLIIGIIGTVIARFQPRGMAQTLFVTAIAHTVAAVIALILWNPVLDASFPEPDSSWLAVIGVNVMFVVLFTGSALLFLRASTAIKK
ncbi:MAG: hypothetical protein EHM58_16735 [Ignavibacteriae bacterium]|nr:MAG: hypothetical protein EHM58_16735 [Ignavibacteriota bacterium]